MWVVLAVSAGSIVVEALLFASGLWLRGVGEDISLLAYMFLVVVASARVARTALHRDVWGRVLVGVVGASALVAVFIHILHNYLAPQSFHTFIEYRGTGGEVLTPESKKLLEMAWRNGLMALFNFIVYAVVGIITGWVSSAILSGEKNHLEM